MKKYLLSTILAIGLAPVAHATVTIAVDAGDLTTASGAAAEPNGGLLLLVSTPGSTFGAVTIGNYATAGDTVLAGFAMNNNGGGSGHSETNNSVNFTIPGGVSVGNDVELLWFPTITYTQYLSGTLPKAGTAYGAYAPSPLGVAPSADGGNAWVVPADGSVVSFNFYTSNSVGGGAETPAQGQANSTVAAAPEPSSLVCSAVGLVTAAGILRRRRNSTSGRGKDNAPTPQQR